MPMHNKAFVITTQRTTFEILQILQKFSELHSKNSYPCESLWIQRVFANSKVKQRIFRILTFKCVRNICSRKSLIQAPEISTDRNSCKTYSQTNRACLAQKCGWRNPSSIEWISNTPMYERSLSSLVWLDKGIFWRNLLFLVWTVGEKYHTNSFGGMKKFIAPRGLEPQNSSSQRKMSWWKKFVFWKMLLFHPIFLCQTCLGVMY